MKVKKFLKQPAVIFNGETLSMFAWAVSGCAGSAGVDQVADNWWFSFGCSFGRQRTASNIEVIEHVNALQQGIVLNTEQVLQVAAVNFKLYDFLPSEIVASWISALKQMHRLAAKNTESHCHWTIVSEESNKIYVEVPEDFFS